MTDLLARARAFQDADPDEATRAELAALLDAVERGDPAARVDLEDRFAGPLEFGTAGLRGVLGAGENRMNLAVVIRTTWGLAQHLLADRPDVARARGVALGHDARRGSREFAEAAAGVLAAHGIPVHLLTPRPCPTPLVAFAAKHLSTAAAIVVTASHNPPKYNGYKVYGATGAQIIPPEDARIASFIERAPRACDVAIERGSPLVREVDLDREYLAAIRAASLHAGGDRSLRIVYTALHGVGDRLARRALAEAGFTNVTTVPEQAEPDGAFPTVAFPNPEEKGALDLALAVARRERADLVIANDPDADRLAAVVRDGPIDASEAAYVQLTGNELGVLLGHDSVLAAVRGPSSVAAPFVVTSCVSSPQLGRIAERLGCRAHETLTGFKWICGRAIELEAANQGTFVFGYEEALGYCVGRTVRDKDGIGAAVALAELAAELRAEGKTLLDRLRDIALEFGLAASLQVSIVRDGPGGLDAIEAAMARLRQNPPAMLAGTPVVATRDVLTGKRRDASGGLSRIELPSSNVLVFDLADESRVIARPSGTEPKLKLYVDVTEPVVSDDLAAARRRAASRLSALAADLQAQLELAASESTA